MIFSILLLLIVFKKWVIRGEEYYTSQQRKEEVLRSLLNSFLYPLSLYNNITGTLEVTMAAN